MAISAEKRALLLEEQALLEEEEQLLRQSDTGLERGERTLLGNIFERPGATSRAAIQEEPALGLAGPFAGLVGLSGIVGPEAQQAAQQGARFPEEVPRFQDLALQKGVPNTQSTALNFLGGLPASTGGLAADIATEPAAVLASLIGKTPTGGGTTLGGRVAATGAGQAIKKAATTKIHPIKNIRESVSRFKVDFINENLFPRVSKIFAENVDKWSPGVQSFARRKLKMPVDMVKHIGKRSVQAVRQGRAAAQDSLDNVALNIQKGFQGKLAQAQGLYDDAFASVGDDTLINIERSYGVMRRILFKNGFVDKAGNLTKRAADPLQNKALRRLASEYKFLSQEVGPTTPTILGPTGKPLPPSVAPKRLAARGVNKNEWNNLKNAFSEIAAEEPGFAKDIGRISDALHAQAEAAGLRDISSARSFFRKHMEHINTFKKVKDEGQLAGLFKQGQKARDLSTIDKYLQTNNLQQAKDVIAGRSLQQLDDIGTQGAGQTTSVLKSQLNSAADPKNIKSVKRDFFEDMFGKDVRIDRVFREINSFRRDQLIKKGAGIVGGSAVGFGIYQLIRRLSGGNFGDTGPQQSGG